MAEMRPFKGKLIKGSRGFVSEPDGFAGLRLETIDGEVIEIVFPESAIPAFQSTLSELQRLLRKRGSGTGG